MQDLPQVEAREVAVTTSSFEDVEEKKMTKIWGKLERSKLAAALLLEGLFAEKRAKICSLQHQGEGEKERKLDKRDSFLDKETRRHRTKKYYFCQRMDSTLFP